MSEPKNGGETGFVAKVRTTSDGRVVVDAKDLLREKKDLFRRLQLKINKRILAAEAK